MTSLSPEQLSALKEIASNVSYQVSAVLNIEHAIIQSFIDQVNSFVMNANTLHRSRFFIQLKDNLKTKSKNLHISEELINKNLGADNNVFCLDRNLDLIEISSIQIQISDCERLCFENNSFGMLFLGTYCFYMLQGKCIKEIDLFSTSQTLPWPSKLYHPISEISKLFDEHKENCIDHEKEVKYWKNKESRILLAKPENTEAIFQRSLIFWLKLFLTGYLKIFAEPGGFGQNKTDISIVTAGGCFVVELKWLGKNESNTECKQEKIDQGIIQIKIYLEKEDYIAGYLVIYDGRIYEQHLKESDYNKELLHQKCDPPIIIFLESESPSIEAKRIQKELG